MIQRTSHSQPATERLRFVYAPIRAELDEVEDLLRGEVRSDFAFIDRLAQHGFQLGGKRLRPALVLLSGLATGPLDRNHLVAAAVLELIHTATLIHNDVLDEANLRRHLQTVNAGWGNEASVLLGDYLFARSICMAATFSDVYVTRTISDATRVMCEGELRQVGTRGCYDLSEQEYLDIVAAKPRNCALAAAAWGPISAEPPPRWRSRWSATDVFWASPFRSSTTCSTSAATRP